MDPFTLAMLAGTGISAIGKLMAGASASAMDKLQAQAYGVQAKTAQTNTDLLNKQADVAGMGVDFAASKERGQLGQIAEAGRQTLAAQRSYFAGGNLDPTFGSPLVVQAMTAGRISTDMDLAKTSFAVDKANAMSNEASIRGQATGSAGQALNALFGEAGAKMKSSADMTAAYFGAASSLLGGAGASGGAGGFGGGSNLSSIQVGSQSFPAFR